MIQSKISEINMFIDLLKDIKNGQDSEMALRSFSHYHLGQLIDLMVELRAREELDEIRKLDEIKNDSGRTIVEGFSEIDMKDAFSNAIDKVTEFFAENHDIGVTVLGLVHLPMGGYRAVLEVHITTIKTRMSEHIKSHDLELKHGKNKLYYEKKLKEEHQQEKLIMDHFLQQSGATPHVPDYFMVRANDAEIMNKMIEKEFFRMSGNSPKHAWKFKSNFAAPNLPKPEILVRFNKKPTPEKD